MADDFPKVITTQTIDDVPIIESTSPFIKNVSLAPIQTGGTLTGQAEVGATIATTVETQATALYAEFTFIGSKNDGLTSTASAGASITRALQTTLFNADATNNDCTLDSGVMGTGGGGGNVTVSWDDDFEIYFEMKVIAGTAKDVFIGVNQGGGTTVPNDATYTTRHYAFMIDDTTLYSSNANATTQTKNAISGITLTDWNTYKIKTTATDAKFYINDVLYQTHTTNLPTGNETANLLLGLGSTTVNGQQVAVRNNYSVIVT